MAQRKEHREAERAQTSNGRLTDVADRAQQSIERLETAFGAFWEEASGAEGQPYLRHVARANVEMIRFMGRQTRAFAELPARIVACQSPHEIWMEQMQFMRHAWSDYQAATDHMLEAMTATARTQARAMDKPSSGPSGGEQKDRDRERGERSETS